MDKQMFDFYKAALVGEISTPLCAEYKSAWRKCGDDKEMLLRLSLSQQSLPFVASYAYQGKGLTKGYVKKAFSDYINGYTIHDADGVEGYTYGLFVDYDYDNDLVVDKDVVHIMWTVGASVVVPKTKCPVIYVSNRSNVHLVCEGFNAVKVYLFDESKVTLEDVDEESSVTIFKYSDDAKVDVGRFCLSPKVHEFRKELKL